MEVQFTDNIVIKLADVLNPVVQRAKSIKIAVAFMKQSGYSLIERSLRECLDRGGEVEFLVGLDFRITEPGVLRTLWGLSSSGLPIRCYCFSDDSANDMPVYHPKLYLLNDDENVVFSVGSSNLTRGGLRDNVEVNAVIKANLREEIVSDIYGLYTRLKFEQKRVPPDLDYIEKYEAAYRQVQRKSIVALQGKKVRAIVRELKEKEKSLPKVVPTGSELFGWQKLVYERVPYGEFRTSDMYVYEKEFESYYPENRHIKDKVRQILQQLGTIGLLKHPRRDRWERI
ncbi:MAG: hypothetical protein HYU86_06285 [Chloroflexi bacterium]|nr:hypothetical protein [Chloroflexota bacterium]